MSLANGAPVAAGDTRFTSYLFWFLRFTYLPVGILLIWILHMYVAEYYRWPYWKEWFAFAGSLVAGLISIWAVPTRGWLYSRALAVGGLGIVAAAFLGWEGYGAQAVFVALIVGLIAVGSAFFAESKRGSYCSSLGEATRLPLQFVTFVSVAIGTFFVTFMIFLRDIQSGITQVSIVAGNVAALSPLAPFLARSDLVIVSWAAYAVVGCGLVVLQSLGQTTGALAADELTIPGQVTGAFAGVWRALKRAALKLARL